MTHDYRRNGTTSLFAALNVLDGTILSTCMPRHRHQEWLKFLKLFDSMVEADKAVHVICDNHAYRSGARRAVLSRPRGRGGAAFAMGRWRIHWWGSHPPLPRSPAPPAQRDSA